MVPKTMRRCTWILFASTFALTDSFGCHGEAPAPKGTRWVKDATSGLCFLLPTDWIERDESGARVYSGPEGTDAYFSTLTLQTSINDGRPLFEVLQTIYTPLSRRSKLTWLAVAATSIRRRPAIRFEVTFTLEEAPRRQAGLIIDTGERVLSFTYTANADLFVQSQGVFAQAVDSLHFILPFSRRPLDEPS
jgi:hypothetical protein